MRDQTEAVIESVSQWTAVKANAGKNITFSDISSSTIQEGNKNQQQIPYGGIALAASLVFTSVVLPNATDRSTQSVQNTLRPVSIFRCEKGCTSSSADDDINERTELKLVRELETMFRNAKNEIIESAYESYFSSGLNALLLQYGNPVVAILSDFIRDPSVDSETASEALRVMGRAQGERTEVSRFRLLIQALNCPSPIIRDSAALALSDMDEPGAIPYLKEAAKREEYSSLKNDYLQIVDELEVA